jgi:L-rhamnose mutarotase
LGVAFRHGDSWSLSYPGVRSTGAGSPDSSFEGVPSGSLVPLLLLLPLTELQLDEEGMKRLEEQSTEPKSLPSGDKWLRQTVPKGFPGPHEAFQYRPRAVDLWACMENTDKHCESLADSLLSEDEDLIRRTLRRIRGVDAWFLLLPNALELVARRCGATRRDAPVDIAMELLQGPLAAVESARTGGRPPKTSATPSVVSSLYERLTLYSSPSSPEGVSRVAGAAMRKAASVALGEVIAEERKYQKAVYDEIRMRNTRLKEKGIQQYAVPFVGEALQPWHCFDIESREPVNKLAESDSEGLMARYQAYRRALMNWAYRDETWQRCGFQKL